MSHMDTMANVRVVIDEIKNVMELPELERGNREEKIRSYDINFENVCFAYNDKKKVFDNLSFSAKENKLTAIVGYSGGGKSTIAKLIAGYWNINKGKISVGNVNLKDVSLENGKSKC